MDILKRFKENLFFNGKTFKGWTGNNGDNSMKWFRIEEGAIIGSIEKGYSKNEFLRSDREYSNFELRLKFKLTVQMTHIMQVSNSVANPKQKRTKNMK